MSPFHRIEIVLLATAALCHGVELKSPPEWVLQKPQGKGIVLQYMAPKPQTDFTPNLNVSVKKLAGTADSLSTPERLFDHMIAVQKRMFPVFKVEERVIRDIGTAHGMAFVATYSYADLDVATLQYVYRHGDEMVNAVYSCLARDFRRMRPTFETSLATLKP